MISRKLANIFVIAAACSVGAPALAQCIIYQHRDFKGSSYHLNDGDTLQMGGERCGHTQSHGTPRGRMLTGAGFAHLGMQAPAQSAAQFPLFNGTDEP